MSKIKLIVEIEKRTYELIKDKPDNMAEAIIANGIPYKPTGDAISREALKNNEPHYDEEGYRVFYESEIDNAQVIPLPNNQVAWEQGFEAGLAQGKQGRPQGEWRDNLIEVFRQSAEVGGDTFHLFEIERIINGEPI